MAKYDINTTTLGDLLDDPEVVGIFDKYAPGLASNPMLEQARAMNAGQAIAMAGGMIGPEALQNIRDEVEAL